MGTPEFAVASLDALIKAGHRIIAVVTVSDKPAGRGKKLQMSAVKKYAIENKLPLLTPIKLKDPTFIQELKLLNPDLQIVVAFRMLPKIVWDLPPLGTFNLHASLLPQYRGAAPINHAIINGEKETGVTTFFLDHDIDTGKIIDQRRCFINDEDDAGALHDSLMTLGANLVVDTVEKIGNGTVVLKSQEELLEGSEIKHAPKLFREDGLIDWNQEEHRVYNKIRGLSPYPGAWAWLKGTLDENPLIMKIYAVSRSAIKSYLSPGSISVLEGKKLLVHTQGNCIEVLVLQLQGKKRMKIEDFLRGFSFLESMRFSS